jgi:hypothetical protein
VNYPIHNLNEGKDMFTVIIMGGRQVEALLLSVSPDRFRAVIPGRADTAEFRMVEGQWTCESGNQVELGAILSAGAENTEMVMGSRQCLTRAAV